MLSFKHLTLPPQAPSQPSLLLSPDSSVPCPSLPPPGARYFTKVLYLSVLCWSFSLFLFYWLVNLILWWNKKWNGIFDHMCYSWKTVWSNVPKTSKQNLISDEYALFLLICFVLQLRSKSLVKLCYLPKYKRKFKMHCNIDIL